MARKEDTHTHSDQFINKLQEQYKGKRPSSVSEVLVRDEYGHLVTADQGVKVACRNNQFVPSVAVTPRQIQDALENARLHPENDLSETIPDLPKVV